MSPVASAPVASSLRVGVRAARDFTTMMRASGGGGRVDEGYLIDQDKLARVEAKHRVTLREMVEICERVESELKLDPAGHDERYMMQGVTGAGRALRVICVDDDPVALGLVTRLITAFEWKELGT